MGRYLGTLDGKSTNAVTMELPVASGATVQGGDFVYFSSGRVTAASIATQRLAGFIPTGTPAATGNAGGTVKVLVIVEPRAKFLLDNDNVGTTFAASHVGQYFDLTGASGAQLVDTSTASTTDGQLVCLEYNPSIDPVKTDTTWGVYAIAEHAFNSTS